MRTKNAKPITTAESKHLAWVKAQACSVCGAPPPNEAHHLQQGSHFLCVPCCADCHRGSFNGIHGQRRIWQVMKKTELSCLNDTVRALAAQRSTA